MSDFAPPTGPPPPKVPEGWKAVWNDQYKEWFFVNLHTKQSTWEKPTAPATQGDAPPSGAPPTYSAGANAPANADRDVKGAQSNSPYHQNIAESDEAFARRLQEQENQRGQSLRGASDSYYDQGQGQSQGYSSYGQQPQYQQQGQQQQQYGGSAGAASSARGSGGGLLGKLKDKLGSSGQRPSGGAGYGQGGYGQGGYGQGYQPGYGMGPPPQQQMYGGYQQGGYGYGQQPMYAQRPKRGGMGAGGAAALGVGGGLLGGMLLADAIDDHDQGEYDQGYQDGMDNGDMGDMDGGGDF